MNPYHRYFYGVTLAGLEVICECALGNDENICELVKLVKVKEYPLTRGNTMGIATTYATIPGFAETKKAFESSQWLLWRLLNPEDPGDKIHIEEHQKVYQKMMMQKSGIVSPSAADTNKFLK